MRIHTNVNQHEDIYAAARQAGVTLVRCSEHGSRSHARAFDVLLSGDSPYRLNTGGYGSHHDEQAASWDQWGIFLGALFDNDPKMKCWAYADASDFHVKTNWRFDMDDDDAVRSPHHPRYRRTRHHFQGWHTPGPITCTISSHVVKGLDCGAAVNR